MDGTLNSSTTQTDLTDDYAAGFSPDAYQLQNYSGILPEDRFFIESITQTTIIKELNIEPKSYKTTLDVGNAGVFIGPGLMSPFVKDGGRMIFGDVGNPQLHKINKTIKKGQRGHLGNWQKFEDLMAQNPFWQGAIKRAFDLGEAKELNVFDLEPGSVDAATMCFGSESFTDNKKDFETATARFLDAVKPGGLVIWCAMVGSQGYDSPGNMFSAFWIEAQDMIDIAEDKLKNVHLFYANSSEGARRHGGPQYSGMALLLGVKA